MLLSGSVCEHCGAMDVDSEFMCALQYGFCKLWLEVFRAVSEVCFSCANVCGVGHGIFSPFWESEC